MRRFLERIGRGTRLLSYSSRALLWDFLELRRSLLLPLTKLVPLAYYGSASRIAVDLASIDGQYCKRLQ
jgi:hypothetical protein